jgi:hypothetical protein
MINNLNDYKVKIELDQEKLGINYNDHYIDLGIDFIQLQQGIKKVYKKLLNK